MASRLHRIGSIYSRVESLIRKGILTENDKPIWFDVYKRFPPKKEPTYKRAEPDMTVREILYKEDALRAKIHKAFQDRLGIVDLESGRDARSKIMLRTCQQYVSEGMSEDEAVKKLELDYSAESQLENTENTNLTEN